MAKAIKCGCGRSKTGYCVGWHSLSEEDYQKKLTSLEGKALDSSEEGVNSKAETQVISAKTNS